MTWRARATALGLDGLPVYELRARLSALTGREATSNDAAYLAREIVKRTEAAVDAPAPETAVAEAVPEPPALAPPSVGAGGDGSALAAASVAIAEAEPDAEPARPVGIFGPGVLPPGIYEGLDAETYHAHPAAGSTEIRLWEHSWADAERRRRTGPPSAAMDVGTAIHAAAEAGLAALLSGTEDAIRCVTPDPDHIVTRDDLKAALTGRPGFKGNWSTDAMTDYAREHAPDLRLWADEIPRLRAAGLTPLEPDAYDRAMGAIEALRRNPLALQIVEQARREVSYIVYDDEDGIALKGRVDLAFHHLTIDLKTSARPEAYSGHRVEYVIRDAGWNVQAAMYERLRVLLGEDAFGGGVVLVTSEPPHVCEVLEYDDDLMTEGRERFAVCRANYARHKLTPGAWRGWSSTGTTPQLVRAGLGRRNTRAA